MGKVCFEEGRHLDACDDVHRFPDMARQDIIQRNGLGLENAFQFKVFAKRKTMQGV